MIGLGDLPLAFATDDGRHASYGPLLLLRTTADTGPLRALTHATWVYDKRFSSPRYDGLNRATNIFVGAGAGAGPKGERFPGDESPPVRGSLADELLKVE